MPPTPPHMYTRIMRSSIDSSAVFFAILLVLFAAISDRCRLSFGVSSSSSSSSPSSSPASPWFSLPGSHGKEIEATYEWTSVGENDTVAAGMHIRIDMTTGEKWVKLNDDDDNDSNTIGGAATTATATATTDADQDISRVAQTTPSQSTQLQVLEVNVMGETNDTFDTLNGPVKAAVTTTTATANETDATDTTSQSTYDYDMMHRTLSKLPDDEIQRMQLPVKPPSIESLSPEARVIFEQRMKQIWEDRQNQLRALDMADFPLLLKDRINAIRDYLDDPATHLLQLGDDSAPANKAESDTTTTTTSTTTTIRTIVDVLKDLEYHLQDLDMTRDFHTLGGWSLLASLLHDDVHYATVVLTRTQSHNNFTDSQTTLDTTATMESIKQRSEASDAVLSDLIHQVQAHAAWALGTAVKNTGEFAPYVLEQLTIVHNGVQRSATALDLVLRQLQASMKEKARDSNVLELKVLRLVYCLGSFLRGNRAAQVHFGVMDGPSWVAQALQTLLDESNIADRSKLACRFLNLATDAVLDRTLHRNDDGVGSNPHESSIDDAIVTAWTTAEWCVAVKLAFLEHTRLQTCALKTLETLTRHCTSFWSAESIRAIVESIQQQKEAHVDSEPDEERLQTIRSLLDQLPVP